MSSTALALARACHPAPTVAVTAMAVAMAAAAGNGAATCAVLGAAVVTGQLTVGWSNDRIDWRADQRVGRRDKPVATGELSPRTVEIAIMVAAVPCVALSLALGWRAGLTHLAAVACGWIYNIRLKSTWFSWLPYALAFVAVPLVATLALPDHPRPATWVMLGAACLGVAANLTNALPDLDRDEVTGLRGLASRIGARPSLVVSLALLAATSAIIAFAPAGRPSTAAWVGLVVTVLAVLVLGPVLWRRGVTDRTPFYALMALVPVDIVALLLAGHHLR